MNDYNGTTGASRFIERLCRWLIVIVVLLGSLSLKNAITDFGNFSAADVPGVRSGEDIQMLERLNWATFLFTFVLWGFLAFAVWSLWKRRNWARKMFVGVLGFVAFCGLWWVALLLAAVLGVSSIPGPPKASTAFKITSHVFFGGIGVAASAVAYACWKVIKRLRSHEIVSEFSARET